MDQFRSLSALPSPPASTRVGVSQRHRAIAEGAPTKFQVDEGTVNTSRPFTSSNMKQPQISAEHTACRHPALGWGLCEEALGLQLPDRPSGLGSGSARRSGRLFARWRSPPDSVSTAMLNFRTGEPACHKKLIALQPSLRTHVGTHTLAGSCTCVHVHEHAS